MFISLLSSMQTSYLSRKVSAQIFLRVAHGFTRWWISLPSDRVWLMTATNRSFEALSNSLESDGASFQITERSPRIPAECVRICCCHPCIVRCVVCSVDALFSISSLSCTAWSVFFRFALRVSAMVPVTATPVSVHPIGPARARNAVPAATPPPPAANAPPPSHASAALVAAAPDSEATVAPVLATPKVVATAIAAVGPKAATATPAPAAVAPVAPRILVTRTASTS